MGSGYQTNRKIAGIDKDRGLIAQLEECRLCEAEAMGSNPIESTFDAPGDANHQGRAESQANDSKRPCTGLHSGRYMGLTEH